MSQRIALVTGGMGGLGEAICMKLSRMNIKVVVTYSPGNTKYAEWLAEMRERGYTFHAYPVDVADYDSCAAAVAKITAEVGPVDILINNAGIVTGKKLLDCPDELMEKTVQVNTISHFWTLKAFLPAMMKANKGHVVTIASAAGMYGTAGLVDYCASKFGAVGTAEALYLELRKEKSAVLSTSVCPYYINTGMFDGVKTKFPLLLPILDPDYVADRVVLAILRGEEWLVLPATAWLTLPLKVLPVSWVGFIAEKLGLSNSMNNFKGRPGADKKSA